MIQFLFCRVAFSYLAEVSPALKQRIDYVCYTRWGEVSPV